MTQLDYSVNRITKMFIAFAMAVLFICNVVRADVVTINAGSLTMNFDANALATETDFDLNGQGPLLVLARHYSAAEVSNRRLTSGNFNNTNTAANTGNIPQIRAVVNVGAPGGPTNWTTDYRIISAQPGYTAPPATGLVYSIYDTAPSVAGLPLRFPQSTNFQIDSSGDPNTASGRIGVGGADAFYFANGDFLVANAPGTNISFGDYSISYDASRLTGSTSGWVISTHLGVGAGGAVAFDTSNISLNVTPSSFNLTGSLIVASDVTDSTTLRTGANVGTFNLSGFNTNAVPEPSAIALVGLASIGGLFVRRRRS